MRIWYAARKKSQVLRKSVAFASQVPRALVRATASHDTYLARPPLVGNSFPKSGTHLLVQILEGFPGARSFGSFVASTPSLTLRERTRHQHVRRVHSVVPGEVVGAHMFYGPEVARALLNMNCAHFFIYRDLRDVAVSEAHYLTNMNKWHRLHRYFSGHLKTDEQRISAAILGIDDPKAPCTYPHIGDRFRRYRAWLEDPDTFCVRYEDLITAERKSVLRRMVKYFSTHVAGDQVTTPVIADIEAKIDPGRSHTYREGKSGNWRKEFTEKHRNQIKEVAGQLLIELGYENDLSW